jgi:hypothetical protein
VPSIWKVNTKYNLGDFEQMQIEGMTFTKSQLLNCHVKTGGIVSGRVLTQHVQGPVFDPQHHKKKTKNQKTNKNYKIP